MRLPLCRSGRRRCRLLCVPDFNGSGGDPPIEKRPQRMKIDPIAQQNVERWLREDYDAATKAEIRKLIAQESPELNDAFYTHLEFGTGGMRGIMGPGTNRMNVYTVARATQGLANYLRQQGGAHPAVFIGYDSRTHSRLFAETAAKVLAGNQIHVYLFKELRPTPLVSFGCRFKRCQAAIMITASHNTAEYNGYKVYWDDGGQVLPPHDIGIIQEILKVESLSQIQQAQLSDPLIKLVLEEIDTAYLAAIGQLPLYREEMLRRGSELKIIYTSLHGTGITLMPQVLQGWGFTSLAYVEKQIIPDGHFTFAPKPNPEELSALQLGIDQLKESQSDILIATDPDADRVGVVVNHRGQMVVLTGNHIACLCLHHILQRLTELNQLPLNGAFVKTIVTTELFRLLCQAYRRPCFETLTGFKYIAEVIRNWENQGEPYRYIFGGEESYGYLWGTQTRDKDALSSAALVAEMALVAKLQGKTLIDLLHALWQQFGIYEDKLRSLNFPESQAGKEQMAHALDRLRSQPPTSLDQIPVLQFDDFETLLRINLSTQEKTPLPFAPSNVLIFWLEDGSKVMVRPSGTEPKVKIYCGVTTPSCSDISSGLKALDTKADRLISALVSLLTIT